MFKKKLLTFAFLLKCCLKVVAQAPTQSDPKSSLTTTNTTPPAGFAPEEIDNKH